MIWSRKPGFEVGVYVSLQTITLCSQFVAKPLTIFDRKQQIHFHPLKGPKGHCGKQRISLTETQEVKKTRQFWGKRIQLDSITLTQNNSWDTLANAVW